MSDGDEQVRTTEVLRLRYVEGLSIRSISRRLQMARKTVR
jgi:DNA-directed RNA polymerase specialized sigma24 family protein